MYKIFTVIVLAAAGFCANAEDVTGTVKAANLNVRVLPGTSYAVVATLKKGDTVTILAKKDKWIKIKAPKESSVWISTSCLKDDTVVKETKLRAGPGISYNEFGTIKKGTKVKPLAEKRDEWVRLETPDELTAWTATNYVDMPQSANIKTEDVSLPPSPDKKADDKQTKPDDSNGKKTADPLPFVGKSKDITLEGVIVSISGATYVTHAIAVQQKDQYVLSCYLHYKKSFKPYENKLVKIRGFQKKVKNWKYPMIEVDSVKLVE